jgi:hypothetical protein
MQQQTYRLSMCQRKMTRVSMESTRHAATDLHLSMSQRKMTRVSMESTRHAATDLHPVNESEKDDQGQHGVHQAATDLHQQTYPCQ